MALTHSVTVTAAETPLVLELYWLFETIQQYLTAVLASVPTFSTNVLILVLHGSVIQLRSTTQLRN